MILNKRDIKKAVRVIGTVEDILKNPLVTSVKAYRENVDKWEITWIQPNVTGSNAEQTTYYGWWLLENINGDVITVPSSVYDAMLNSNGSIVPLTDNVHLLHRIEVARKVVDMLNHCNNEDERRQILLKYPDAAYFIAPVDDNAVVEE